MGRQTRNTMSHIHTIIASNLGFNIFQLVNVDKNTLRSLAHALYRQSLVEAKIAHMCGVGEAPPCPKASEYTAPELKMSLCQLLDIFTGFKQMQARYFLEA